MSTQSLLLRLFQVRFFFTLFLPTFVLFGQVFAQTTTPNGQSGAPPKFPALFRGDDVRSIYQTFEKRQRSFEKSEFETSQQFVNRVRALMAGTILAKSRTALDEIVYVTDAFDQTYDADTQTLTITVEFSQYYSESGNDTFKNVALLHGDSLPASTDVGRFREWKTIELASNERSHGSAVGTTAFGIKKRIKIKSYTSTYLALHGFTIPLTQVLKIKLPIERARAVNDNTFVAISGTPMYPFIAKENNQDTPTLTSPEASYYYNFYLFMNPRTLSVYDLRTGEILDSVKLPVPAQPKTPCGNPNEPTTVTKFSNGGGEEAAAASIPKGAVITPLKFISKPLPVYTAAARKSNIQGTVTLRITFLASGEIGVITPFKCLPDGLTEQAIVAARQIIFEPQKLNGVPQTVTKQLDYAFSQY